MKSKDHIRYWAGQTNEVSNTMQNHNSHRVRFNQADVLRTDTWNKMQNKYTDTVFTLKGKSHQ